MKKNSANDYDDMKIKSIELTLNELGLDYKNVINDFMDFLCSLRLAYVLDPEFNKNWKDSLRREQVTLFMKKTIDNLKKVVGPKDYEKATKGAENFFKDLILEMLKKNDS